MCYFGLGNVYWTFNLQAVFCLFETLKMFYPPKGLCKADTEGGPIVFTYVLFCVRKRILDFQFTCGFLPFWDPPNVLSPGGTLQSRARKGSNCFYLCFIWCRKGYWHFQNHHFQVAFLKSWKYFIPRRGLCRAEPERGPIAFTYVLFWVRKRILDFQFAGDFFPFRDLENVLSPAGIQQSRARIWSNCFYLCFILG